MIARGSLMLKVAHCGRANGSEGIPQPDTIMPSMPSCEDLAGRQLVSALL